MLRTDLLQLTREYSKKRQVAVTTLSTARGVFACVRSAGPSQMAPAFFYAVADPAVRARAEADGTAVARHGWTR